MSTSCHLYLKKGLEKDPRFTQTVKNGIDADYFGKLRIFKKEDEETFYYQMDFIYECFPEILKDVVEKVSIRTVATMYVRLRCGRYSYRSATATVDCIKNTDMIVAVQGQKFEDARDLYYKIRTKKIFPDEDWDGEQTLSPPRKKGKIVKFAEYLVQKVRGLKSGLK